jgi:hypothetical protein
MKRDKEGSMGKRQPLFVFLLFILSSHFIHGQNDRLLTEYQSYQRVVRTPVLAIKTNLLYDATTSFNLGTEWRLSNHHTLDISVDYNPWTFSENKKLRHAWVQPEFRHWLCESFYGHFVGFHGLYAHYNIGGIKLPLGTFSKLESTRYQGDLYGGGVSYGYQRLLSPRWNLEATIGIGYVYADFTKYDCSNCGKKFGDGHKHYFGPTKVGLSLVYVIK